MNWGQSDMSSLDIELEQESQKRRLTTIVVADICGYSALSEKDQGSAIRLADLLYTLFEKTTDKHGGRVFKRIADGFLAEFPSARSGMEAALEFGREVNARHNLAPNAIDAKVSMGIHVGDVVDRMDGDILGHGVNIAARLQAEAAPGTILASSNIINLLGPSFPHKGQKRGALHLKNIDETVTAYQIDPDKSHRGIGFGRGLKTPKWIRSRALLYAIIASAVFYSAMNIQSIRQAEILEVKLDQIVEQNFKGDKSTNIGVSAPYIRNVLENLHRTNIPSHQASFALLEEGHIGLAIERLEESLERMEFGGKNYVDTMHQIAALNYHYDTNSAIAWYEALLKTNPKDKVALQWLIQAYNLSDRREEAYLLYEKVISEEDLAQNEKLILKMNMAFNSYVRQEYDIALEQFIRMKKELEIVDDPRLWITWKTNMGAVYERLDKLNEAEGFLVAVLTELQNTGADTNMPRASNVLGQIYEKKADIYLADRDKFLNKGLEQYFNQLEYGKKINKKTEITEASQYIADVYSSLGNLKQAEKYYIQTIRYSKSYGFHPTDVRAHLGLAYVQHLSGQLKLSCKNYKEMQRLQTKKTVLFRSSDKKKNADLMQFCSL